jgi:hypothetical protein
MVQLTERKKKETIQLVPIFKSVGSHFGTLSVKRIQLGALGEYGGVFGSYCSISFPQTARSYR